METNQHTHLQRLRLPAAVLSLGLVGGTVVMGGAAMAEPLPAPEPGLTAPISPPEDISALKQTLAKHRAAVKAARLLADHPQVVTNANNAFTADWRRCVIIPESSGDFHVTSGAYGILVGTWHAYGMSGVPGDYPPAVQARIALRIYHDNGGFGPDAWNNSANCSKNG